jgi:hypothetical protein
MGCHGPTLSGNGAPGAPDITPARLGSWTETDFRRALRAGVRPDGSAILQTMPWIYAGKMTDAEIRALWLYLRSLGQPAGGRTAGRRTKSSISRWHDRILDRSA